MPKRNRSENKPRQTLEMLTISVTDRLYGKLVQYGTGTIKGDPKRRAAFTEMMTFYGAFMEKFIEFMATVSAVPADQSDGGADGDVIAANS